MLKIERRGTQGKAKRDNKQSWSKVVPINRLAFLLAGCGGFTKEDSGKDEQDSMNDLIIDVYVSIQSFPALSCKGFHFLEVCLLVGLVELQRFLLGGTFNVWLILQQLLDSCQNCLHCDVRLPVLLVVEN